MGARTILPISSIVLAASMVVFATQAYQPVVIMNVTLPDGQTKELSAPESGLATTTLKDGREFGFRPTLQDDKPWTRIVVTIFRMGSPNEQLGEIEVKTGGGAVQSKTTPAFKVAVPRVTPPRTSGREDRTNANGGS